MLDGTEFFECACHSDEHTLRFILSFDDDDPCIYTSVFLRERQWWKRIWPAVKYVFGYKCRFGHWDCFELKPEDAQRLMWMAERLVTVIENRRAARATAGE